MLDIAYTALLDFLAGIKQRAAKIATSPRSFVPFIPDETRKPSAPESNEQQGEPVRPRQTETPERRK